MTTKNNIRGLLAAALMTMLILGVNAQSVTTPRAVSPASELSLTIGISTVTINYSRPIGKRLLTYTRLITAKRKSSKNSTLINTY